MNKHLRITVPLVAVLIGGVMAVYLVLGRGNRDSEHAGSPPEFYLALDHATVAVKDLAAAGRLFDAMGFTIKPGRIHDNSINNLHIKFADGTSVELLTATEARDPLSNEYLRLVEQGDGGAFVALRTDSYDTVTELWERTNLSMSYGMSQGVRSATIERGHPLRPVWLLEKADPGRDEPAYTTHANTALRLAAVWFRGDTGKAVRALLGSMGLGAGDRIDLSRGTIVVTELEGGVATRALVGVTIEVADFEAAAKTIAAANVDVQRRESGDGPALIVRPEHAAGIWIEIVPVN